MDTMDDGYFYDLLGCHAVQRLLCRLAVHVPYQRESLALGRIVRSLDHAQSADLPKIHKQGQNDADGTEQGFS